MQTRWRSQCGPHDPGAPCLPRALAPGPPGLCAHPPCHGATEGPGVRARTERAPVWFAAPTPPLPSAPRPAPSHLPHARLCAPLAPHRSRRYPTSIFSRFTEKPDQLFRSRSAPVPRPPPQLPLAVPGASPPPPPPARRSAPRAPALAATRSARLPAPPAAALRAPSPDVTGRSHGGRWTSAPGSASRPAVPSAYSWQDPGERTAPPRPAPGARTLALPDALGHLRRGDR